MANVIDFNKDENKQATGQQSAEPSASITPVSAQAPNVPATANAAAPGTASSGRFTNIQKYIGANKGAGQQVASAAGQQIQKQMKPGMAEQANAAEQFKAGVDKANESFGRSQQYGQQLNMPAANAVGITGPQNPMQLGINTGLGADTKDSGALNKDQAKGIQPVSAQTFDPNSFVNDQNKLLDFTKLRTGQGIDELAIRNQAQKSQDIAGANQLRAQELANQAGSVTGRAGLVSSAFNRPSYSQGQQRLDNLFLTGDKGAIGTVKNAAADQRRAALEAYGKAQGNVTQAGDIATQETAMQKNLQDRANALESNYMDQLKAMIDPTNANRAAEQARWEKNFQTLTGKNQGSIDSDFFDAMKLKEGEHSFNVLNDPDLALRNIANISQMRATTAGDVASQADVDMYNKLAALSKGRISSEGTFAGPDMGDLQLQGPSQLDAAIQARTGEGSLRGLLDASQKDFSDYAKGANISGSGSDTGSSGLFGGGGTASANMSANLANYLGLNNNMQAAGTMAPGTMESILGGAGALAGTTASIATGGLPLAGAVGGITGSLGSGIGNLLTGAGGGSAGSMAGARNEARRSLLDNITNTLLDKKYGNYVTRGGVKDTSDLIKQQRSVDEEMSDYLNRYQNVGKADAQAQARAMAQSELQASGRRFANNEAAEEYLSRRAQEFLPTAQAGLNRSSQDALTHYQGNAARQRDLDQQLRSRLGEQTANVPSAYNVDDLIKNLTKVPQGK